MSATRTSKLLIKKYRSNWTKSILINRLKNSKQHLVTDKIVENAKIELN